MSAYVNVFLKIQIAELIWYVYVNVFYGIHMTW
jgi:hypothetical protein